MKCNEFQAFTSLEVKFLVDSSSCSNNKSLTNAIVISGVATLGYAGARALATSGSAPPVQR